MRFVPAFLFASLCFPTVGQTESSTDSKVGFEYGILPKAVGTGRRSEGWLAGQSGFKWTSDSNERLRFEALIATEFLVLSPSVSALTSQIPGSPQAGKWNRSGSPHYFEDRDLFVEYQFGRSRNFRASLGSRTLRWGVADFFDPLDQVNSRRMERPAQSSKRGEWMLYSEWRGDNSTRGALSLETFVIPVNRGAILPSQTSPWLPRQLYVPNRPDAEFILPDSLEYTYGDREDRESALRWNAGARLNWRPGENEISLQYDEVAAGFPSIRASVTGPLLGIRPDGRRVVQADPLVRLSEVYYSERHYGASIVRPIGSSLLRFQFGKTEPLYDGRALANDRSDFSLAIERQVNLGSIGQLTLLAQGFKNALENDNGGNDIASFSTFFDRAAAVGLRLSPTETTTFMLGALRSLTSKGGTIVQTSLTTDLNSTIAAELGWTWYEANLDSPIGPFKDNDGGSLKITSSF